MPDSMRRVATLAGFLVVFCFCAAPAALAELPPVEAGDLAELSLEALMDLEVTSVSKKASKLSDSPAAIYVVTNEDIRRSGVTSIPEALRMVPGVHVAQISANRWAISTRGFNGEFANKLLVLIDGRSVYTPLFSGVFWDVQDVMLEDVDRIEVIRGPGATLWGANAVNGVINIITRSAEETQGGMITSGAGTEERAFGSFRWGGEAAEGLHYRVYGKYFDRDEYETSTGVDADDGWEVSRGGFRVDWDLDADDLLTFQGDFYRGDVGERHTTVDTLGPPVPVTTARSEDVDIEGWNLLGRWTRSFSPESEASLQLYVDRTKRDIEIASEVRDTFDIDFQHRFAVGDRHDLVWGSGFRWGKDRTRGSLRVEFDPEKRRDSLFSAFVQDEIALVPEKLSLTVGSKFEHNDYTGFEYQPGARMLYKAAEHHTLWTSVARAVRTPSRAGDDVLLVQEIAPPGGPPAFIPFLFQVVELNGSRDLKSEKLMAYEAGWRFLPSSKFSTDLALFYNEYRDVRSVEVGTVTIAPPNAFLGSNFANEMNGYSYGAEIAGQWEVKPWWRISGSYSFLNFDLHTPRSSTDTTTESGSEGVVPTHLFHVRSFVDLPRNFELDTMLYYVENLSQGDVPSYVRADMRLGWSPRPGLRLSLVGQNLLQDQHEEYDDAILWPASEVERAVYGKVEWSF